MLDQYEKFTDAERKILEKYVTTTTGSIFVLRNLPEVIKGALFSRYSRSTLGLRTLLLREFIDNNEEAAFKTIVGFSQDEEEGEAVQQTEAIKKAQNFYDRILDGYGDDSIGELGGAHIAIENITMLAAKVIEDCRIGGSPLEKSTRYIYFDQQVKGKYLFYREPVLMTSAFRDVYQNTCNMLFETYSRLIPPLTKWMEEKFPREPHVSERAYAATIRAKTLDCLRGLLPTSTLTNMGLFANGRFFEMLVHKLNCQNLVELQDCGKHIHEELNKVIPSFIRRSEPSHKTHQAFEKFFEGIRSDLKFAADQVAPRIPASNQEGVNLISYDPDAVAKVAAALLYPHCDKSLKALREHCRQLSQEEIIRILDAASASREHRRQKSPRALEHAEFTFEIVADFGAYRDLQRHRTLTQERQFLSCNLGYFIPQEIVGTSLEEEYRQAMDQAKEAYGRIATEFPEEAQYIVPMAYNIRWCFHLNLRALQWLCELRSAPAGHPNYRHIAQTMAKQVCNVFPIFDRFFKFVDYEGYDLGRLGQEVRTDEKRAGRL